MPFPGEIMSLSYQLLDGDSSKFCRAVLLEPDGTPLAVSPVAMLNIGGGKYTSDAALMPVGVDYVEARYEPFNDIAFIVPDPDHCVGTDVFALEVSDPVVIAKLDEIIAKLAGIALPGATFSARLVQATVCEVLSDVKAARALVERNDVKGVVTAGQASAVVDNDEITAKTNCK